MATAKKKTTKKSASKSKKPAHFKSFKVVRENAPFMSFKITEQTVYWSILLVLILILALWILNIQINLSSILDSINPV